MLRIAHYRGCLLGLAAGDALGTTVEFRARGSFPPLTDIVGGGPFGLEPGQWTDDTSMALCLATSLVECEEFDARDQMQRYRAWREKGYLSSTGRCFDIGNTVSAAIARFAKSGEAFAGSDNPKSAGNGCIMRLAPVPMRFAPDLDVVEHHARDSSRTTHAAPECLDASALFARMIARALGGESKESILTADARLPLASERIRGIARAEYRAKNDDVIRGSGYVVESLEAALWAFARTRTFADAVRCAANLGDDADTTAAVCGQLAGAYYGDGAIPSHWLDALTMRDEIRDLAERLFDRARGLTAA